VIKNIRFDFWCDEEFKVKLLEIGQLGEAGESLRVAEDAGAIFNVGERLEIPEDIGRRVRNKRDFLDSVTICFQGQAFSSAKDGKIFFRDCDRLVAFQEEAEVVFSA